MKRPAPFRLKHPPRETENDVERGCLAVLRRRSYWPVRLHAGTFKTVDGNRWIKGVEKGTPDYGALHELYPGFLLEVKRPGERLSPEQEWKIWEIRQGFKLSIAAVDGADQLEKWLDAHEQSAQRRWAAVLAKLQIRGP